MKNLLFILCLLIALVGYSQEDVTITSQADIDNFNHTEVRNLSIDGTDLEVISGFESLVTIDGYLKITNNRDLVTIAGFDNLIEVGTISGIDDLFTISNNLSLESIEGFSSLKNAGGHFYIDNNASLIEISDFVALTTILGSFRMHENAALMLIDGFPALNYVERWLRIYANNSLELITGFVVLNEVGNDIDYDRFQINNNPSLTSIDAFKALKTVNGFFEIDSNDSLSDISNFEALEVITHYFKITNNRDLVTIAGFDNLIEVGTVSGIDDLFTISNNLSLESIEGFSSLKKTGGHFYIDNNASLIEISDFVALTTILGSFRMHENAALMLIDGFPALNYVERWLRIYANNSLELITGFAVLNEVGNDIDYDRFQINNNPSLTSIDAFKALKTVNGFFEIDSNDSLSDISNFEALEVITHYFKITNNRDLVTIAGFDNLIEVGNYYSISENLSLLKITGFNGLKIISKEMYIQNNSTLCNISAFDKLLSVSGSIYLRNNLSLSECCIFNCIEIENIAPSADKVIIQNNAPNCQSLNEIKSACNSFTCANDCTENVDDCGVCGGSGPLTYYEDIDGDGMGNPNTSITSCCAVPGFVLDNSDTDDCPDEVDECAVCNGSGFPQGTCDCAGTPQTTYNADTDGDGLGDPNNSINDCEQPTGYVTNADDTDDTGGCDGEVDECGVCNGTGFPEGTCDCDGTPQSTYYADTDGDGLGDPNNPKDDCQQPEGYVTNADDDDDTTAACAEFPEGFCDCAATIPQTTYYRDNDGDGFGTNAEITTDCSLPEGFSEVNTDLDDTDPTITDVVSVNLIALQNLSLYPNPTTGFIQIKGIQTQGEPFNLQITDTQGKVILTQALPRQTEHQLHLNNWVKGIYFLNISNDQYIYHQKLMMM